jgi:hypothetical protein
VSVSPEEDLLLALRKLATVRLANHVLMLACILILGPVVVFLHEFHFAPGADRRLYIVVRVLQAILVLLLVRQAAKVCCQATEQWRVLANVTPSRKPGGLRDS